MATDYFDEFEREYGDEYNDDYPVKHVIDGFTDEDAWYAMTDGMYGDYPGGDWDPEWFGF